MNIVPYTNKAHRQAVIALWTRVFAYATPHNKPESSIDKKMEQSDGLFFVAENQEGVIGTILAGYDGHRGWLYSLCVKPEEERKGVASTLLKVAEQALEGLGCMKINLQVTTENAAVASFYEKHGYQLEPRVSMGKLLKKNLAG